MSPFSPDASPSGEARLELLQRYGLAGRIGDPHLSRLTRMVAASLDVPVALLALAGKDEFLLLSAVGPGEPWTAGTRLRLDDVYCGLALQSIDGFVLDDASAHPFRCTSTVGGAPVAAYAGVPVLLEGHPVGVLCAVDVRTRAWSGEDRLALEDLASLVQREWTLGLADLSSLRAALDSERFRSLSAGAFDATAIHDRGRLVEVNDTFTTLVGQPREALIGRSCIELLVPEVRDLARPRVLSLRDERHETKVLRPDGTRVAVEVRSKPITFDGRSMRLMVIRDLTEQRRATRALEESEALLRGIADSVIDPLFAKDLDGRYLFANAACARVNGMSVDDMVGHTDVILDCPGRRERFQSTDREALESAMTVQLEERLVLDGGERIYQTTKAALRTAGGEIIGVVGVARDITTLKAVEAALRETGERMAAVVRAQQEIALAGLDLDSVMTAIAERAQELTGASGAVVEMVQGDKMVYSAATGSLAPFLDMHLGIEGSLSGLCARSGEPLWCEDAEADERVDLAAARRVGARSMLLVPLSDRGRAAGVLKVVSPRPAAFGEVERHLMSLMAVLMGAALRDAAAFQAKQALQRELEHSNAALADFARAASHDLQEPLRKIRAFGTRLLTRHADGLDPVGRACVERMAGAATRMQALIDDLLDFARTTRGLPPDEAVDLGVVVDAVLDELDERITELDARVEVGPLPRVVGHPTQLQQLLRNLLSNALKFHRPASPPRVRVSANLSPRAGTDDGRVELRIDDDGIGFEPEYAARIFEIFERLNGRSAYPGTGIGLALCKRIVEHHRGSIRAEGRPGQGATFIVELPAASSLAADPAPVPQPSTRNAHSPEGGPP